MSDLILSDKPISRPESLENLYWFLERILVPYVKRLGKGVGITINITSITPGEENTVLVTDNLGTTWAKLVDANIADAAAVQVSKLAAGTNTYVLTTVAGVPVWAPAAAASGVWETLLDADLTTGGVSTYTFNGQSITRGGAAWVVDNIATTTQCEFNASGYQVTLDATLSRYGSLAVGTKGPVIRMNTQQLGGFSGWGRGPIRVQFRFSIASATTNFQFAKLGFENTQNTRWCGAYASAGYSTGLMVGGELYSGLTGYFTQTDALGASDVAEVRLYPTWAADFSFGTFGADWPVVASPIGTAALIQGDAGTTQEANVFSRDAGAANANHIDVAIGAQNTLPGGPAGFQVTVSRVRVQQYRTTV